MSQERIELLSPNITEIGQFIADNAAQGFTLQDGPVMYGWQWCVIMVKGEHEAPAEKPKAGRPAAKEKVNVKGE